MMAVDSKLGETKLGMGANTSGTNGAAATPSTVAAAAAAAEGSGLNKRAKRTSSLMRTASALPKVEHSLDEFIARANQTLVDVSTWGAGDQQAKDVEDKRREQDAQRWKQAETQMKEGDAREQSLRRQLDGLQGKLAEAEARAAIAMSASSSGGMSLAAVAAQDAALSDLRSQVDAAQSKMKASDAKSADLSMQLQVVKTQQAVAASPLPIAFDRSGGISNEDADERVQIAEAKAVKALAAARAAAAGLTVSSADLAAIESGLVVPQTTKRGTPWIAIMLAFAGGIAIMFVIWKFALSGGNDKQVVANQSTQPAPAPAVAPATPPTPAAKPTVTPIDDSPTAVPAAEPTAEPIEPIVEPTKPEPEPVKAEPGPVKPAVKAEPVKPAVKAEPVKPAVKAEPEPVKAEPVKPIILEKKPKPAVKKVTPAPQPAVKPATPKKVTSKVVDPFDDAPKKPAVAPATKKPAVIDPF